MYGEHTGTFALAPKWTVCKINESCSKSSIECITEWGRGHTWSYVIAQQLVFQNGGRIELLFQCFHAYQDIQ